MPPGTKSCGHGIPGNVRALLAIACALLFAGRAWLYFDHRTPLSVFFWNENWLGERVPRLLGVQWENYAAVSESLILTADSVLGTFFVLCAIAAAHAGLRGGIVRTRDALLLTGTVLLTSHGFLRWVDTGYQPPVLLEYAIQAGTPFLLVGAIRMKPKTWYLTATGLAAATFCGHGLYALGWPYPVPHHFTGMTMVLTGLGEEGTRQLLAVAGALDLAAAALFFAPGWPRIAALLYAFGWGAATALARVLSHVTPAEDWYGLHPWLAETLLRAPHALVPLAALTVALQITRVRTRRAGKTVQ